MPLGVRFSRELAPGAGGTTAILVTGHAGVQNKFNLRGGEIV
ncbi:MAG TPA: hypothetical protein VKU01_06710 [Bryobacteraceae bacterium]|nr:hypothetical protein [Bryobacteraceae bacterium]